MAKQQPGKSNNRQVVIFTSLRYRHQLGHYQGYWQLHLLLLSSLIADTSQGLVVLRQLYIQDLFPVWQHV